MVDFFSIKGIHEGLRKKEFSAREVVGFYLKNIKEKETDIRAFLEVFEEQALEASRQVDEKIAQGEKISILEGVPYAVKDNILVKNLRCTAASKILQNYIAPFDATVVERLKEKGGSVLVGKTNLDEFAMGSSTENSAFFATRNPFDISRVPGGSSGGSAAAVAAREAVFSLGSDTGGSIRQPAAFCSVVGLKPTYGAVSRYGLIAFASSLDQIGPLTNSVDDAEIIFDIIKGKDVRDSTSYYPKNSEVKESIDKKYRIGLPREYFDGVSKEVREVIERLIKNMKNLEIDFEEIFLPHTKYALACYMIIAPSEASSNLARYDGIRYAPDKQTKDDIDLIGKYFKTRGRRFGAEVKRRIMLGTFALSSGYYDAYYVRAQKIRTLIKRDFEEAFKKVDAILAPTSPTLPFKLGEKSDPLQMYMSDVLTVPVSLAGLPAINVPSGFANNLPVGVQIIGPNFSEKLIFDVARLVERARD